MESTPADPRFSLAIAANGRPTINFTPSPGQPARRLSDGDDPVAYLAAVMEQLKPARVSGQPLFLQGTADGYLLTALARHPTTLPLGRQQCVYVLEPNPGCLLLSMMIHDLSGDNGPIRQSRFQWFVGAGCTSAFRAAMLADPFLPFPQTQLSSEPDGAKLAAAVASVLKEIIELDRSLEQKLARRYADFPVERLVRVTGPNTTRPPRALLLTTRFSTVLQYSTADTAAGLRELGWETHVVMEPTGHHSLTFPGLRTALLDFDPDVVVQIDHTRTEHGTLFPGTLPFLCWTQDHLPNLTNAEAGRNQGPLDFLLTDHGPWYARNFAYPPENNLPLGKLTRVPALPESWSSDGPDLCYVSNAGKLPVVVAEELVASFKHVPELQSLARLCTAEILGHYDRGQCFHGTSEIRAFIDPIAAANGYAELPCLAELATELFERLNNVLYRQQALKWAGDFARERGLNFAIYGNGWDKHPQLADFARGYVAYGAELEALTRSAKINLQIVPYFCLHQRLLDGIVAGGFYLVRAHPSDTSVRRFADFLARYAPSAPDLRSARAVVPPDEIASFERLASENAFIADRLDPVELVRVFQGQGLFVDGQSMPPRIDEVGFASPEEFNRTAEHFLAQPELRRQIAMQQRSAVEQTFSYREGMRRVISQLHQRLAERYPVQQMSLTAA